jgi:hypothetical protein
MQPKLEERSPEPETKHEHQVQTSPPDARNPAEHRHRDTGHDSAQPPMPLHLSAWRLAECSGGREAGSGPLPRQLQRLRIRAIGPLYSKNAAILCPHPSTV